MGCSYSTYNLWTILSRAKYYKILPLHHLTAFSSLVRLKLNMPLLYGTLINHISLTTLKQPRTMPHNSFILITLMIWAYHSNKSHADLPNPATVKIFLGSLFYKFYYHHFHLTGYITLDDFLECVLWRLSEFELFVLATYIPVLPIRGCLKCHRLLSLKEDWQVKTGLLDSEASMYHGPYQTLHCKNWYALPLPNMLNVMLAAPLLLWAKRDSYRMLNWRVATQGRAFSCT